MAERIECAVIGAGVIGLACARALALSGREVVIIEAADAIGTATSSRNSEVIHAGIYYTPGSLKARLCRTGRDRLYAYLADRGIGHRRLGKLIVATTEAEVDALAGIAARARANGVADLRFLDASQVKALEPAVACRAALLSPSTGILDSHALMLGLQGDAEAAGAALALNSPVTGGRVGPDGIILEVGGAEPMTLRCRAVVNSAGLHASQLARSLAGFPADRVPATHYAKGSYFALAGRAPFRHLVYPVPGGAGLGIHFTSDLGGQGRFGPDVEWVKAVDYGVDPGRIPAFAAAIRRYWPDLAADRLHPAYAGVRPKVQAPGEPPADFVIQGPESHGVPGLVNLFGIESPGLTACLAIADTVAARLAPG
ncbi:MAG: NAD(P)/FAD-dependent oxidoreductase [Rhodospirillales bacterium]|nr:MAG: NAD(P)/FAD-dependent oxidoreductase [Rhodospirillales bacterium]